MPQFSSSDHLYTVLRAVFERMLAEGRLNGAGAKLRIRITLTHPAADLLINTRVTPPKVTFGPSSGPYDLEATTAADTLHALWSNQLEVSAAVGRGLIKLKGSPLKAISLKPLFDQAKQVYPAVLAAQTRHPH
jgi:hypothetical protein